MYFNFVGYAGWDLLLALMPKAWQTKRVALAWIKMATTPDGVRPNLGRTPMVLQMPWGSFKILDYAGNVERVARQNFQI